MEIHSVKLINEAERKGICSICGETTVYRKTAKTYKDGYRWICKDRKRAYAGPIKLKYKHTNGIVRLLQEERLEIVETFKSTCSICKKYTEHPHLDHCHKTGKIRGILCPAHNQAIGLFQDNIDHLREAINYLET